MKTNISLVACATVGLLAWFGLNQNHGSTGADAVSEGSAGAASSAGKPSDSSSSSSSESSPLHDKKASTKQRKPAKHDPIIAALKARQKSRLELIRETMVEQPQDAEWGEELQQRFASARGKIPGYDSLNLMDVDCYKTICALHIDYAQGAGGHRTMLPRLKMIGTGLSADVFVSHAGNPNGAVLYISRPDKRLPQTTEMPRLR